MTATIRNPMIDRLADALARRTEEALGQLDALDGDVARAFAEAERAADHAIAARLVRLEADLAGRSRRFETKLADMLSSAVDVATEALGQAADALASGGRQANGKTHDHAAALTIPAVDEPERIYHDEDALDQADIEATQRLIDEERQAEYDAEERAAGHDQDEGDDAERCPVCRSPGVVPAALGGPDWDRECLACHHVWVDAPTTPLEARQDAPAAEPTPEPAEALEASQATTSDEQPATVYQTSAARSLERDAVGVLAVASPDDPEDDDLDDLDGEDEEPRATATTTVGVAPSPATTDPSGLHERRGRGRSVRYVACPLPIRGEVYHRKAGRRWVPVEYAGD